MRQGTKRDGLPKRPIRYRRCRLGAQFGDQPGQAGNAIAEQRRVRTIFQMLDAIAPVGGRKGFAWRAGDDAFQMNEFAFENVVMHGLNPREWPVWSAREVANDLTPRRAAKSRFCSTQWTCVFMQCKGTVGLPPRSAPTG